MNCPVSVILKKKVRELSLRRLQFYAMDFDAQRVVILIVEVLFCVSFSTLESLEYCLKAIFCNYLIIQCFGRESNSCSHMRAVNSSCMRSHLHHGWSTRLLRQFSRVPFNVLLCFTLISIQWILLEENLYLSDSSGHSLMTNNSVMTVHLHNETDCNYIHKCFLFFSQIYGVWFGSECQSWIHISSS